jgi:hypothetical protein
MLRHIRPKPAKDPMNLGAADETAFYRRLQDRLTQLRLQVDLGELSTSARFRALLEEGGEFALLDPRVRSACLAAGLGHWLG